MGGDGGENIIRIYCIEKNQFPIKEKVTDRMEVRVGPADIVMRIG